MPSSWHTESKQPCRCDRHNYGERLSGSTEWRQIVFEGKTRYIHPRNAPLLQGIYYWRVRAMDTAGNWGSPSDPQSFRVFIGSSPQNGVFIANTKPTLIWIAMPLATGYTVQLAHDEAFNNLVAGFPVALGKVTRYTLTTPLAPGTYFWRVVSSLDTAANVPYKVLFIGTPPSVPVLTAPTQGASVSDVVLQWDPVTAPAGVTLIGYEVQVASKSEFTRGLQSFQTVNPMLDVDGLDIGKTYFWRVRAIFAPNVAHKWSGIRRFILTG